jgi:hypothetical protein
MNLLQFSFFILTAEQVAKTILSCVLVLHACNPSYSRGRDQEDHGLKPAQANSFRDPTSKNPSQKKGWWSGSRRRPWVQALVPQKTKQNKTHTYWLFFFLSVLEFELMVSCLLGRCSTTWATPSTLFCDGFFQDSVSWTIGWTGFEPLSSWSLPPE